MSDPRGREFDADTRRYVLDLHARLDTLTFYEILGVPRGADPAQVKRAYFKLVRVVHPDRYFGADLGDVRPKLEAVFARMTQAYETLTSNTRAVYDASIPAEGARRAKAPTPVDPAAAARKKAALEALGSHLAKNRARVDELTRSAARALAAGDVAAAAQHYEEALRLAPNDGAVRGRLEEARRVIAMRNRDAYRRQAQLEEKHGRWAQAAAAWQRAVELDPRDVDAAARLAAAKARAAAGEE